MNSNLALIKGAGDLASGVACVLKGAGFRVVLTETEQPTCVRRKVSFAEAVYAGEVSIRGITGRLVENIAEARRTMDRGQIAVLIDPRGEALNSLCPEIFIDATMLKRNCGLKLDCAPIVIALGPGFEAGVDARSVIETQRGPQLGEPLYRGTAAPNTGIPGDVLGYTSQRVLRAPLEGTFNVCLNIGDLVNVGDTVAYVNDIPVRSLIDGVIRGLLKDGLWVHRGMKVGDVHPEKDKRVCYLVTDKALLIGQGVLKAIHFLRRLTSLTIKGSFSGS